MNPAWKGTAVLTVAALGGFAALRLLPDTQCTLLHASHEPLVLDGAEYCGVNEQANYYSPAALRFPVSAALRLESDFGELSLLSEGDRPFLRHEVAVSHTRQVHLHLRQEGGAAAYAHVHPVPTDDGRWRFDVPPGFRAAAAGSRIRAFVDFVPVRTRRTMLAECSAVLPGSPSGGPGKEATRAVLERDKFGAGESATIRARVVGGDAAPVKLRTVMGSLGHAVVFGDQGVNPGYAHMHPSWEGNEREDSPVLAFRLKMPGPGSYDLWLHIDDGEERYLRASFEVTP
jgi:hypothetical protein